MALTRSTDPLVWIDCEMTGLNPQTDTVMSIACILTTSDLQPLDPGGFETVIQHTAAQLSRMSDWCVQTHGATGLTQRCLNSTTTAQVAANALLTYIKRYIPDPGRALLAGNSIHADKAFLMLTPWHVVLDHLHYRLFDVSATKEMFRRWASLDILDRAPRKKLLHSAREDVLESIDEARYYKTLIEGLLLPPPPPSILMGAGADDAAIGIATAGVLPLTTDYSNVDTDENENANENANANDMVFAHGQPTSSRTTQEEAGQVAGPRRIMYGYGYRYNSETREGDVGHLDAGFRTDVP